MIHRLRAAGVLAAALLAASAPVQAQQPPPRPAYGPAITLAAAQHVAAAAIAAAAKNGWEMAVAITTPSGDLICFARMDDTQFGSGPIAIAKARSATLFKVPTQVFANALAHGETFVMALQDAVPVPGGIPLLQDGKIIGAIGVSGGIGPQDETTAEAGAAAVTP